MKITIIGSSSFAKEMTEYQQKLINLGHEVNLHEHYIELAQGVRPDLTARIHKEHAKLKMENDYIRYHYHEIVSSDAVLVLNFDRKGIANYIGGNTLMELGFAHVHNKKIFLLNPIPEISYKDEIEAVAPVVINGDLSLIV
ncbi:MAG: hypothetical protein WC453_03310 [Patescibacteria group bacterium]